MIFVLVLVWEIVVFFNNFKVGLFNIWLVKFFVFR